MDDFSKPFLPMLPYQPPMQEIVTGDMHTYIQPAPLRWTTSLPMEPGFYWVHYMTESPQTQVVEVRQSLEEPGSGLVVISTFDWQEFGLETFTHWLGPVPVPEPPK